MRIEGTTLFIGGDHAGDPVAGSSSSESFTRTFPSLQEQKEEQGRAAWLSLHSYALEIETWDPAEAARWYQEELLPMVPSYGCDCSTHWRELTKQYPPDFSSRKVFHRWTVDRHNDVNQRLGKEVFSPLGTSCNKLTC